ncbi:MAG: hypothetical protein E7609_05345 [Ruminococcaceae bacterium]|nr:hypothetical protein [Oscillospiraceae bacterium]
MLQKMKLPAAVALFVQSVTFFLLFLVLWAKKKSLASTFLAVSAMGGLACGCLVAEMRKEIAATTVEFDDELDMDEAALKADLSGGDDEESIAF